MSYDDDWSGDLDDPDEDDCFNCPECGAEIHAEAESCPACGYWITDAEREAGWRASSASGRIRAIGLWTIAIAAIGVLLLWWR
jgi:ribosomal protein L37E